MTLSDKEIMDSLHEGFSEAYIRDFGTLISYHGKSGEWYCPACNKSCGSWTGHRKCRENYGQDDGQGPNPNPEADLKA